MAYSKEVNERFYNVLNNPQSFSVGKFDPSDSRVATGMVGAPSCGDVMRIQFLVEDNIIQDIKFKTYGCGSAIASSSKLVDMLIGKTLEEAKLVKDRDIANALQLPSIKIHCSVLAEAAIQKAIEDYEQRQ
jgi:nitrogen fixation NifU-like protein|tara:strand:- start:168 stop:560 length:393 start_codon:yes stop_codon:yes gene_type:complete